MDYLKFGFLILGLILIVFAKVNYTKRVSILSNEKETYNKEEKMTLYSGYLSLIIAVILATVIV